MSLYDDIQAQVDRCQRDYGGDMKRMIMEENLSKIRPTVEDAYDLDQLQKLADVTRVTLNPLEQYSNSELKAELRRRKKQRK